MNPLRRQHSIREFELLVSGGVQQVPESVFERDSRASGELREVRQDGNRTAPRPHAVRRAVVGTVRLDLMSGHVLDD